MATEHGKGKLLQRTALAVVLLLPFRFPGCHSENSKAPRATSDAARAAAIAPIRAGGADRKGRPVYRLSVIRGGAYSVEEFNDAVRRDEVVARHYVAFDHASLRMARNPTDQWAFLSYRIANAVYWTRNRIRIPAGEELITDGAHEARARCGNRISLTPQAPVVAALSKEPDEHDFDVAENPPETAVLSKTMEDSRRIPGSAFEARTPKSGRTETPGGSSAAGSQPMGPAGEAVMFIAPIAPPRALIAWVPPGKSVPPAPVVVPPGEYTTPPYDPPPPGVPPTLPGAPPTPSSPPSTPPDSPPSSPPSTPPGSPPSTPPGSPPTPRTPPNPPTTPPLIPTPAPPPQPPLTPPPPPLTPPPPPDTPFEIVSPEPGTGMLAGMTLLLVFGWRVYSRRRTRAAILPRTAGSRPAPLRSSESRRT